MGKRRKKQEGHYVLWGVLILLILSIIAGLIGYFMFSQQKEQIDKTTLCPKRGATAHTVLLIDKTDPLNFTQKQAFQVLMNNMMSEKIQQGELVSVFALGEDFKENDKPLLEICNPGDGRDKSEWTANLKRLKTQYEDRFLTPILTLGNELINVQAAKQSPIMEQIQMVSINGFQKHNIQGQKRLIMVSDMLQNSEGFSMYKQPNAHFETFEKLPFAAKVQSRLDNVRVEIIYVMNNPKLQTRRNLAFWEKFFNKAKARITDVHLLEG